MADLVADRESSAEELLDLALARVDDIDPVLNAVVADMRAQARDAIRAGLPAGRFTGVPFLLKDLRAAYGGVATSAGSRYFRDAIPSRDSELVARYKAAGLVIFGKTNTPELGLNLSTEPALHGPTCNPWRHDLTAGGSSGGAAAAVAGGIVPMAHGSDGGGSIRIPASLCGLFGLKPTRGRNPAGPDLGEMWNGLSSEHALTRSVRDSAALLDATGGLDAGAPYQPEPPRRSFESEVGADPGTLRVGFVSGIDAGADSECIMAVEAAARLCERLGHRVEEASPNYDAAPMGQAFASIVNANVAFTIDARVAETGRPPEEDELEVVTHTRLERGRRLAATGLIEAITTMHRQSRNASAFFGEYDVWLTPTVTALPPSLGTFDTTSAQPETLFQLLGAFNPFCPFANLTGRPAMSVPLHWSTEGLPVGAQFVGRYGDEATLFRLAGQLEAAAPWRDRRPPRIDDSGTLDTHADC